MQSRFNTRERPRIELRADVTGYGELSATDSLRLHWPEYLMGRRVVPLPVLCVRERDLPKDAARRLWMGAVKGATIMVGNDNCGSAEARVSFHLGPSVPAWRIPERIALLPK
jgi:hypothetical protein